LTHKKPLSPPPTSARTDRTTRSRVDGVVATSGAGCIRRNTPLHRQEAARSGCQDCGYIQRLQGFRTYESQKASFGYLFLLHRQGNRPGWLAPCRATFNLFRQWKIKVKREQERRRRRMDMSSGCWALWRGLCERDANNRSGFNSSLLFLKDWITPYCTHRQQSAVLFCGYGSWSGALIRSRST